MVESLGLNSNKLAIKLGTTGATIGKIVNGKNLPSLKILIPLAEEVPNLNLRWLLLGEGKMFVSEKEELGSKHYERIFLLLEESNEAYKENSKLLREKVNLLEEELTQYKNK